jgi:predicted metal-dependent enzyme (double-stranded beta helix superfamily)
MLPASAFPDAAIVAPIAAAVEADRVLALVLRELTSGGAFEDPALFAPARSDRYARRLLWRDRDDRFVIVAMTWSPGQSAPLHDHGGLWGAEIVIGGTMRESSYSMLERDAGTARFAREAELTLTEGTVAVLVPPLDYHAYANAGTAVAHTVHVYAGAHETCTAYTPLAGDWWSGEVRALHYDA